MSNPPPDRFDGKVPRATVPTHPGIRLLAELAGVLSGSVFSEATLVAAVGTLREGLEAGRCRMWIREPGGTAYHAIAPPGDEPAPGEAERVAESFDALVTERADTWDTLELRVPVVHEGERLGLLACNDLAVAARILQAEGLTTAADELVDFGLSDELAAVRQALGLTVE